MVLCVYVYTTYINIMRVKSTDRKKEAYCNKKRKVYRRNK